jgi:MFS family permease
MQGNQPILRYNSYRHLLFVTLNICLSSWIFGVCNGYFNSIKFADISNIYQLDGYPLSTVQGVLTGIISFTAGIGAYLSKYLLNYFTRKRCFEILSIATILTCILVQYPTLPILFISRCLQGMIIGMISSVTSIYVR